ncbi:T-cell antigen CD7 [Neovison vison]|uniref:T-cell antigen CD7 n=1 Tax=Neovison vison TaxID=452646 RepID=UPI001CF050F1|nr:T-cell antigen CD7 [Neogale vison]
MAPELPLLPLRLSYACTLLGALATQEVRQLPPYTIASEGGSINITCSTSGPLAGVYLKQRWPKSTSVIYYEDKKQPTIDECFQGRVAFSGLQHNLTITLSRLQPADAGAYVCQAVMDDVVWGPGTLVLVTDEVSQEAHTCQKSQLTSAFPVVLAASCFFLGLAIGAACVLRKTQVKRLCCAEDKNSACVVYEDMSCGGPNRMCTPNEYQ